MAEADTIVVDVATRIFQDLGDPQTVNNAGDDSWRAPLWQALTDSGLTLAWVPETAGGSGGARADGFAVLGLAGAHAVTLPLAETLLGGWLLAESGLEAPQGPIAVAPTRHQDRLTLAQDGTLAGTACQVPFARDCDSLALAAEGADGPVVALVAGHDCAIRPGLNLAGEAKDDVIFDGARPRLIAPAGADRDALMLMGAAARAMQMAGALQTLLDLSVRYAGERKAFGRPIAKFQVIQHDLARLAGETAAAVAAANSAGAAIEASERVDAGLLLDVAAAKIRVGEAAGTGAAIAHQVHGAIGYTKEHILHRFTHRLWSWRDDFGPESVWATRLGESVAAAGADELWPTITAA
ncbi:MAG: acyl-CoA dehydrogenase family protein [Alphaproteobacteria bacterium]|jgi:alkylation response protein AidB-like acyl-CoA dehydrogenase|nr:acyl-CoA dehydrogenase family protein [Alphaproteobacteria bacterium]MDP6515367.1 acyl-CoA dehydrogenase family protein [Alphaproteobacteria bacterium]